jgi:hypothetical protein
MKPRVYLETTIPSYLTAWPSGELLRAADQRVTHEWWETRFRYELFISELVLQECRSGDEDAARQRLEAIAEIPRLDQDDAMIVLADSLVLNVGLPPKASSDAMHIAIAAVSGVDYLVTWNCRHIANVVLRSRIERVCRAEGFAPPIICTPRDLLEGVVDG